MDTKKQATRAHTTVKRLDLSVYTLFELEGGNENGPGLPSGVATAICGPMADSPAARRLQLFIASCAEGGLPTKRILDIFCEWADVVESMLPDSGKREDRMYRTGLRRAIKSAKTIVAVEHDHSFSTRKLVLEIETLCEQMSSDWDVDHPAVYTGWTLLLIAQDLKSPLRLDAAWGHAAAILGSIALLCQNEDELEDCLEGCADVVYRALFGMQALNVARDVAKDDVTAAANVNAGTRRSDRTKKSTARRARKERRSA